MLAFILGFTVCYAIILIVDYAIFSYKTGKFVQKHCMPSHFFNVGGVSIKENQGDLWVIDDYMQPVRRPNQNELKKVALCLRFNTSTI